MDVKPLFSKFLQEAGVTIGGYHSYDIRVYDERLYGRLCSYGSLGAGEGYMEGWWDCDSLDQLFFKVCNHQVDAKFNPKWRGIGRSLLHALFNLQTKWRSLQVAEKHYNLGNRLYEKMLGPSMAYTCGYWKGSSCLDEAQWNKFELVCRKANFRKGERILDLGCGWGSFAKYAAERYGVEVVAVNISKEQVNYAKKLCKGLPISFHLADYRDDAEYNPKGERFDRVVSIGLCEHIGIKNYRHFMDLVLRNLKDEGLFILHTIGRNDTSYCADPWINKYIFPNGMLPSIKSLGEAAENRFVIEDLHNFGADYDKTLMAWQKNFAENWETLRGEYDDKFYRLWNYYLLSCAGAFRARSMQLWQIVLSPRGVPGGYESVRM